MKKETLEQMDCFTCGGKATEVIFAEERLRVGWYCPKCQGFEKAIFRERTLEEKKLA